MRSHDTHIGMQDAVPAMHADALSLPTALLASLSHDLRNPLSVILGASEVLHDSATHLGDEDRQAHLRAIRRECVRMDEYVKNLFQVARLIVGGSAGLVRERARIDELARSAVERLQRYRDGVKVHVDGDSPLQPVSVNAALVEQGLLNVLDNAAKFAPPGSVISVSIRQHPVAGTRIDVADGGPGIARAQRERVFGVFFSEDPQSRGRGGSGLGLAISRSIFRAHGGDVVVADRSDGLDGAVVRLTLPAPDATDRR